MDQLAVQSKSSISIMEKLLSQVYPLLYRFILLHVRNIQDTEDILQETLIRIVEHINEFTVNKGSFKSWMYKIVRNQIVDYFRNSKKNNNKLLEWEEFYRYLQPSDNSHEEKELISQILNTIELLPPQEKEVIRLYYYAELSNKEIAKILNLRERSVSSILSKAKHKLNQLNSFKGESLYEYNK